MILEPHELKAVYAKRGRAAAMARDTGMSYSHVCHVLQGRAKNPTLETLKAMSEYAGEKYFFSASVYDKNMCIITPID